MQYPIQLRHTTRTNEALINPPKHIGNNLKHQKNCHTMNEMYEIVFINTVRMTNHALWDG